MHPLLHTLNQNMFQLPIPWQEKVLRSVILYLVLIAFLRLFGKRELAQLNPFDLVVLLTLSNTVQNAIIGNDNSVTGGIIGAFVLLAVNWGLMWLLYRSPSLSKKLEGHATTLIEDGVVNTEAQEKETLTDEELISVLNKNGFNDPADVALCVLEPNGTFYVKGKDPSPAELEQNAILAAIESLSAQVRTLEQRLDLPRAEAS